MTAVAFLADAGNADGTLGGAELTMREFATAAPDGVEVVGADCIESAEAVVIGNCVTYGPELIEQLHGKRVVRYHNDLSRHEHRDLREWLERPANGVVNVFTSPLHDQRYGGPCQAIIPPAIDLDRFRPTRQVRRNTERVGAVTVGAFQNPGKGGHLIAEWAARNEPVVAYGTGQFAPQGPAVDFRGPLAPERVPQVLWQHETFVHLPSAVEPFGRAVVEAWAAGCKLVVNRLVGAGWWIENQPERLETAARDFWALVLDEQQVAA